jgi:uncharacterized repeat protein (TIGR01451 family)/uncharacterized repeat protein (TIGR02543 family)
MLRDGFPCRVLVTLALLGGGACSQPTAVPTDDTGRRQAALFDNGGFEAGGGSLGSWTVTTYLNYGIVYPTTGLADLQLQPGGTNLTYARTGTTESLPLAGLTDVPGVPHFPKFGVASAVVNERGANKNVNSLRQSFTTTSADIDPADGKIHARFVLAPALQAAGHPSAEQPYFYVELRNLTRGTLLFSTFNYSTQEGIPWQIQADPGNANLDVLYTDWQLFDIAPGNVALRVGDTIEVEVYAAACSHTVHFGEVYVDGFGAFLPGLSVTKSAPQIAAPDTDLTYTFLVKNDTGAVAPDVIVEEVLPDQTTFVSYSAPGATCNVPAVGHTGTVSCDYGWMNTGAHATFTVTVHIAPGATGAISNGNYSVRGRTISPLLGPLVTTTIASGVTYTDLALTVTDGLAAVAWGSPVTYTVTVTNRGPTAVTGAHVTDVLPAQLTGASWTCTGAGGGSCPASGSGGLDALVDLPVGATATFLVGTTVISGSGSGTLTYGASVATPAGVTDSDVRNNSDADTDSIGALHALTVDKDFAESGRGTVTSTPLAINCTESCATATADFLDGTAVTLTAVARAGDSFVGWTGDCTGTVNTCVVIVDASKLTTAHFQRGMPCVSGTGCATGLCVDGVCCAEACTGQCQACDVFGSEGACTPVTGAPHGSRQPCASDGSVCGGACDGVHTSCAYPSATTACGASGGCTDGVATLPPACNGAGACGTAQTQECTPFVCGPDACLTSCTTASDCIAHDVCDRGACVPPAPNGHTCTEGATCLSGLCVDGMCCDTACSGQCEACDVHALQGTCSPVVGAPHGDRAACDSDGSICGGACDGQDRSACSFPDDSTTCRSASCTDGVATLPASCDGAGACAPLQQQPCDPYVCGDDTCRGDCQEDLDCLPGDWCSAGVCVEKLPPGATCSGNNQCANGDCTGESTCRDQRFVDEIGGGGGCRSAGRDASPVGVLATVLLLLVVAGPRRRRHVAWRHSRTGQAR